VKKKDIVNKFFIRGWLATKVKSSNIIFFISYQLTIFVFSLTIVVIGGS